MTQTGRWSSTGIGVASSIGLDSGGTIFNWTAHPFNWNAADFQKLVLQGDFKTNVTSGQFDDDRLSWTIDGASTSSNNQFGVQLDHPNGGIVTYWSNVLSGTKINDVIVPLTALGTNGTKANTWYRFQAQITKLTATSAKIDVSLVELDASGNPTGTPLTGSIADTSSLASGHTPAAGYFTAHYDGSQLQEPYFRSRARGQHLLPGGHHASSDRRSSTDDSGQAARSPSTPPGEL